jgi:integrase
MATHPRCLTCQKPRNPEQQALSQKQVQITYATELAGSDVSVYTLMKLLGHESMTTSQRYVTAAGTETRTAAAQNPLYALLPRGDEKEC